MPAPFMSKSMSQPVLAPEAAMPPLPNTPEAQLRLAQRDQTHSMAKYTTDVGKHLTMGAIAVPLAIADTFATSLSFGAIGDDDMEEWLHNNAGMFGEYYNQNRGGIEAVGGMAGMLLPAMMAAKAVRTTGMLGKLATKTLGAERAKWITSTGLSNAELFAQQFQKARLLGTNKAVTSFARDPLWAAKRRQLIGRSVGDTLIEGVAAEAAIATTMRSNEFLFPEEMTAWDNAMWFGASQAVVSAASLGIARRTFVRGAQQAFQEGRAASMTFEQGVASAAQSNIAGQRGPALSAYALYMKSVTDDSVAASVAGDRMVAESTNSMKNAIAGKLRDISQQMFRDSPIEDVTTAVTFKSDSQLAPYVRTIQKNLADDPMASTTTVSFELFDATDAPQQLLQRRELRLAGFDVDIKNANNTIKSLDTQPRLSLKQQDLLRKTQNKLSKLRREKAQLERTAVIVRELDGTTSLAAGRAPIFQDGERRIGTIGFNQARTIADKQDMMSTHAGTIQLPEKAKGTFDPDEIARAAEAGIEPPAHRVVTSDIWQSMSHMQRTGVQDLLQAQASRTSLDVLPAAGIQITADTHHTQLDYVMQLVGRFDEKTVLPKLSGVSSIEDIQFASLRSKFFDFQALRNQALDNGPDDIYNNMDNVARALNLPTDGHYITNLFETMRVGGTPVDLAHVTKNMTEFRSALLKLADIDPLTTPSNSIRLSGNMLNLDREAKPVLSLDRTLKNNGTPSSIDLARAVATQRGQMTARIRASRSATFVNGIMQEFDSLQPVVDDFKRLLHGIVDENGIDGAVLRNIYQQPFKYRELEAYQAASTFTDLIDKRVDSLMKEALQSEAMHGKVLDNVTGRRQTHQQIFSELTTRGNEYDLDMFMSVRHALGAGWDAAGRGGTSIVPIATGKEQLFGIMLDPNSLRNKNIWKAMFGEEMPPDAIMPLTGKGSPAVLSERGMHALLSLDGLSQQLLTEHNTLMRAMGLRETARRNLHLPAQNLTDQHKRFIFDSAGEFRFVVGGASPTRAQQIAEQEVAEGAKHGLSLRIATEADMERFKYAEASAWHEMSDYSVISNQTGAATGRSFGAVTKTGAAEFHSMLESTLRQYSDLGRRMRTMLLQPELEYLKIQKAATGASPSARTVFDDIRTAIDGNQRIDGESVVGGSLLAVERQYDRFVQGVWNHMQQTGIAGINTAGASSSKLEARITAADARFGSAFLPFKSVTDYIESTTRTGTTPSLRKHAALLNEVTSAVSIRMLDAGMAAVNFMSLASTIPSVTATLAKRLNETDAQWMRRIGAWGTVLPSGQPAFSPIKALTSGAHAMWTKDGREVLAKAAKRGLLEQYAAEQVELFARTGEEFAASFLRSASNKLSYFTDWSERQSRSIAFMSFYKLGKDGLQLSDDAAMLFAHKQANSVIGDFRPSSRPAIFQGAAGMPLGLFTTYMWNYTQRMVDIVETLGVTAGRGWNKPLAVQLGTQATLFGAESLPGWDMYMNQFVSNYDGTHNVVDRMNEAFGHVGADVFLNGTVSNLPRLFGFDDGISIGPRASAGLPFQYGVGLQGAAGIRLITRTGEMVGKMLDAAITDRSLSPERIAEIYAQANINKMTSNLVELGLGRALDHTGAIIEEDTRTAMGVTSRVLGFKPLFADEMRQENARNRVTDRIHSQMITDLAQSLKSKIRRGRLEGDDVEDALERYVRADGSPAYFGRFLQSQMIRGQTDKTSMELSRALTKSIDEGRIGRLLYIQQRD